MDDVEVWTRLPLDVEMVSWCGGNPSKLMEFTGGKFRVVDGNQSPLPLRGGVPASAQVYDELHGSWVFVWFGDRIVRGVEGEFYPIEPGALAESYRRKGVGGVAELKDARVEVERLLAEAEAALAVDELRRFAGLKELAAMWLALVK